MDLAPTSHGPVKPAWFEFILSPDTLKSHLERSDCDPTATNLITQFFANLPSLSDIPNVLNGPNGSNAPSLTNSPNKLKTLHRLPEIISNGTNTTIPTTGTPSPIQPVPSRTTEPNNTQKTQQQVNTIIKKITPSNGTSVASNGQTDNNNGPTSVFNSNSTATANGQQQAQAIPSLTSSSSSQSEGSHNATALAEDAKYRTKKAHALKTLALKTASFLNWNIELFENDLSVSTQIALMNELKHVCNQSTTPDEYKLFGNILYLRWFVRSSISYRLSKIQPENSNSYNPQIIAPPNTGAILEMQTTSCRELNDLFIRDVSSVNKFMEFLETLDAESKQNIDTSPETKPKRPKLESLSTCKHRIKMPSIDCFDFRSSNNWDHGTTLDVQEFLDSVLYDVGKYFFFGEMYKEAKDVLQRISDDSKVNYTYPHLKNYLHSSISILNQSKDGKLEDIHCDNREDEESQLIEKIETFLGRKQSHSSKPKPISDIEEGEISDLDEEIQEDHITDTEEDLDIRLTKHNTTINSRGMLSPAMSHLSQIPMMSNLVATNNLSIVPPSTQMPQQDPFAILATQDRDERFISTSATQAPMRALTLDSQSKMNNSPDDCTILTIKGDLFMSRGEYSLAMGNFVEVLTIMTEYFTYFSPNHAEEENIIDRMIQCSIKLGCHTQAVVLYQMTTSINYGIAFKQLNERFCNDCCDDLYECIWDITLLEYIIHIHTKRGELERKCRLIQLIGQLELNENNSDDILFEAMQSRRARFYRIMAKKISLTTSSSINMLCQ